jgi:hypothetical protein
MNTEYTGMIARIVDNSLAYVKDSVTNQYYSFTFGKIKGYRGEYPKEMGLKEGLKVTFTLDTITYADQAIIATVTLPNFPKT